MLSISRVGVMVCAGVLYAGTGYGQCYYINYTAGCNLTQQCQEVCSDSSDIFFPCGLEIKAVYGVAPVCAAGESAPGRYDSCSLSDSSGESTWPCHEARACLKTMTACAPPFEEEYICGVGSGDWYEFDTYYTLGLPCDY